MASAERLTSAQAQAAAAQVVAAVPRSAADAQGRAAALIVNFLESSLQGYWLMYQTTVRTSYVFAVMGGTIGAGVSIATQLLQGAGGEGEARRRASGERRVTVGESLATAAFMAASGAAVGVGVGLVTGTLNWTVGFANHWKKLNPGRGWWRGFVIACLAKPTLGHSLLPGATLLYWATK